MDPLAAVQSLGEALLIGLLVGVQRESTEGVHPGLRDFILIALAGGICGLLQQPWLTVPALLSITLLLGLYHYEIRQERAGITTELAAVATFCITYLAAMPNAPGAAPLAIGAAIAVTAFLEFKKRLKSFFQETITEHEFNGTLAFLSVVLVIYPLLPAGRYGPYGFFAPREVWFFVILVSSISYAGYFFQKFLGAQRGLDYTAVLGGIASSLATTLDLARRSRVEPERSSAYARAAVLANGVQFPRTLLILYAANQAMALRATLPLLTALFVGALLAWVFSFSVPKVEGHAPVSGNPFRVRPALTFGVLFAAVVFLNRAASAELGSVAVFATSALGGLVDVGTVILSSSDLMGHQAIDVNGAVMYVFTAIGASVGLKAGLAVALGSRAFAWRLLVAMGLMLGSGAVVWVFILRTA